MAGGGAMQVFFRGFFELFDAMYGKLLNIGKIGTDVRLCKHNGIGQGLSQMQQVLLPLIWIFGKRW